MKRAIRAVLAAAMLALLTPHAAFAQEAADIPSVIRDTPVEAPEGECYAVTDITSKTGPGEAYESAGDIFTGACITAVGSEDGWSLLSDGRYVPSGYLSPVWDGIWPIYAHEDAAKYTGLVYAALCALPQQIKDAINGYTIQLTNDEIIPPAGMVEAPAEGTVLGLTTHTEDMDGNVLPGRIDVTTHPVFWKETFYHECGHAFSLKTHLLDDPYADTLMQENEYRVAAISKGAGRNILGDTQEVFAESFSLWMTDYAALKEHVPDVADYLDALFGGIIITDITE